MDRGELLMSLLSVFCWLVTLLVGGEQGMGKEGGRGVIFISLLLLILCFVLSFPVPPGGAYAEAGPADGLVFGECMFR